MSDKFLLTCECGQKMTVTRSQAGSQVQCACGQPLEVPPLRKLVHLTPADQPTIAEAPIWSLNRGLLFLGAIIALPALTLAGYLYSSLPEVSSSDIEKFVQEIPPAQSWVLWRFYEDGMPKEPTPLTQALLKGVEVIWLRINLALFAAVVGLVIAACGLLLKFDRAPPQRLD